MLFWLGILLALGGGIYVGLGMPGMPGRVDRMVTPGKARREARHRTLDWLKPFRGR